MKISVPFQCIYYGIYKHTYEYKLRNSQYLENLISKDELNTFYQRYLMVIL